MILQTAAPGRSCSSSQMLTYGVGDCANSLVMNGVFGFAMIFFTKALGLNPAWAGFAMAVSVVWEAIFEPISATTRAVAGDDGIPT